VTFVNKAIQFVCNKSTCSVLVSLVLQVNFCTYQGTVGLIYVECDKLCPAGCLSEGMILLVYKK